MAVWGAIKFVVFDLVCDLLMKVLLYFVVMHLEHYVSIMEHIEKGLIHILNCIHHIVPSFSYSQSNLTMDQAKQLLKRNTPPECDIDNGTYPIYHKA